MITGLDSALVNRLRDVLAAEIGRRTLGLIKAPDPGMAGHIRGLTQAAEMLDEEFQKMADADAPRERHSNGRASGPHDYNPQ